MGMHMKKKVLFFGFSVTRYGNPPYPDKISHLMADEGCNEYDITYAALGGVSLECVPYITEQLKKNNPDHIIFEIGTSHYSTEPKEIERTKEIFLQVIANVSVFCQSVDFLLLPRNDIPSTCTIHKALEDLSLEYEIGLLDLRRIFDKSWEVFAIDNVHPSPRGIEEIAKRVKSYLLNRPMMLLNKQEINTFTGQIEFKKFVSHYQYPLLRLFEHSNFSYVAVPLRVGDTLEIKIDKKCIITGIFYIMGPDTSTLDLEINGAKITIRTFDKFSYYYRIGYRSFNKGYELNINQSIKITSSENRLNTVLEKDSLLKYDGIINYPISFTFDERLS